MKTKVDVYRPGPAGLEILHVRNGSGNIPAHVHASWCVVAVERGERTVTSPVRHMRLETGQVALIPPGVAHACASHAEGCDFWAASIAAPLISQYSSGRPGGGRARDVLRLPGSGLAALLARIGRGPEPRGARVLLETVARAARTIGKDTPDASPDCAGPSLAVSKARGVLDGPDGARMSLAELARRTGSSPYHLVRRFGCETGVTPLEYRTLSQLRQARALLAAGIPLAEAAVASGFYDQSHLTLRFKKYMGMTPGQFARGSR